MINYKKFSKLLVDYSLEVKAKQNILINAEIASMPLVSELYKDILLKGANPIIDFNQSFDEIFYKYASKEQLSNISEFKKFQAKHIDSRLTIRSSLNPKNLSNIPSDKIKARLQANNRLKPLLLNKRWSLTLFPTHGYAVESEMSLTELSDFITHALFLNEDDPIQSWKKVNQQQQYYINYISDKQNVHIKSKNCDLKFSLKNRIWINSDGKTNMPSGEIYTTPVENSLNGYYKSSFPSTKYGKEVDGIYLEFKDGKLITAKAEKNEKFFLELLETDQGARTVGEFGIGLNYNIQKSIKNILFDEKIGGTVHIALGNAYPQTGGINKSSIHLDIIADLRDEGEMYFDNELIYKNGKFLF